MADAVTVLAPEDTKKRSRKEREEEEVIIASKVTGTVKWFSVRFQYGFIHQPDYNEDLFVFYKRIRHMNPRKLHKSLADGEIVEFDVIKGEKGLEAINITGPEGKSVRGSQFAANKGKYFKKIKKSKEESEMNMKSKKRRQRNRRRRRNKKSNEENGEKKIDDSKADTKESKIDSITSKLEVTSI